MFTNFHKVPQISEDFDKIFNSRNFGEILKNLHQMFFFSGEDKCLYFFSPDKGANVDLDKC